MRAPSSKPQPASRKPERPPSSQAVGERGRDENLEKGAASQRMMTTQARVCFRKILQRDFLTCRSSRSTHRDSSNPQDSQKASKTAVLPRK
jgi:hypothetical protein